MLQTIENFIDNKKIDNKDELYNILVNVFNSDIELAEINFIMYDKFKYQYLNNKLRDNRDGQEEFRNNLINLDKHCIISGDDPNMCQACHIIPLCDSKSYNINNGILLNYNFHNMFDKFYLSFKFIENIDENYDKYKVILSNEIKNKPSYKNYKSYDNKIIQIRKECRNNLQKKYDEFKSREMA